MNIALVHDWIVGMGGAERVLEQFHRIWPQAPIYTLLYKPATIEQFFPRATIIPSHLQKIPQAWRIYPLLAPLMPSAIEAFDVSAYDIVLSSSVIFSKGIVVRPDTRHICYCYSPTRMLWDRSLAYERHTIASKAYRHMLRLWDHAAAQRPDQILSPSRAVLARVKKYYRRSSSLLHPPVRNLGVTDFEHTPPGEYYLIVARMVPHKALDFVIDAFAKLRYRLVIVGEGPLRHRLTRRASSNITFTGWVSDAQLAGLYARCSAVLIPNEEDWGLTALEAMTYGKPVLALRRGGAIESVIEGVTGEFFDDPIPEALADGMKRMKRASAMYSPSAIAAHAEQHGEEQFRHSLRSFIEKTP